MATRVAFNCQCGSFAIKNNAERHRLKITGAPLAQNSLHHHRLRPLHSRRYARRRHLHYFGGAGVAQQQRSGAQPTAYLLFN